MSSIPSKILVRIIENIPEYWETDFYAVNSLFLETILRKKYHAVGISDREQTPGISKTEYLEHIR
jgi:hypothetical protein